MKNLKPIRRKNISNPIEDERRNVIARITPEYQRKIFKVCPRAKCLSDALEAVLKHTFEQEELNNG